MEGLQLILVVLLHSVFFTTALDFTLMPTPVSPGGRVVLNCTLPTGLKDTYAVMLKDQNDQVLVLYLKGVPASLPGEHLEFYKGRISNINHPDQTKTWASCEYHVPWCYKLQQFKCNIIDDVIDGQSTQDLKIQHIAAPSLYHEGSCLTCGTAVEPLVLDSVNDTALECRLDGVTEASRLVWSTTYFLVPETNLTSKDAKKCIYNHTSTATAPHDHPPGETVDVYCTAITSQGSLKSPVLQVTIGKDDSKTGTTLGGGSGKTTYIVIGLILVAVVVIAIVIGGIIVYKRRNRQSNNPYQAGQAIKGQNA